MALNANECFKSDAASYRKPAEGTLQWCGMGELGKAKDESC